MPSFAEQDQRNIIEQCKADSANHGYGGGNITCTLGSSKYQVKYSVTKTLTTRINTQPWLHSKAEKEDGICVAELLCHFDDDEGRTYLVMEFVELEESLPTDMDSRIEVALRWLSRLRNDEPLGPLGGECILHEFFNEREAPLAFKSLEALERYIAKARMRIPGYKETAKPVTLKEEPLVFAQGILHPSHFGVAKNGDTVIMGLGNMSFLPHSLARYTLTFSDNPAIAVLPNKFGWMGEANMDTMALVAANLAMTGNPTLGLDENGISTKPPTPKKKKKVAATAYDAEDNKETRSAN